MKIFKRDLTPEDRKAVERVNLKFKFRKNIEMHRHNF